MKESRTIVNDFKDEVIKARNRIRVSTIRLNLDLRHLIGETPYMERKVGM